MPLGRHHPTIRRLRALRRDPARRAAESVLVAEGLHLAREALASGARIELVLVSPRLRSGEEGRRLLEQIEGRGLILHETSDAVLDSVQDARSAQPILALVGRPEWPPGAGIDGPAPLVVVVHGVQDPGNLGAIVRTADAAGATALFVCGQGVDPFHPRAVRGSMGSIFRLPLWTTPWDRVHADLGARGIKLVGADPSGEVAYHVSDLRGPVALIFGAEGPGLTGNVMDRLDERVRVPLRPEVDSLSVGASAAVLLFEAARQRGFV